ncbi:MAG: VWA domain-containing protein [Bryobacteraceae bacterium]|nr:VWA domain-containing protein [Bryobacteraceae bacterium]
MPRTVNVASAIALFLTVAALAHGREQSPPAPAPLIDSSDEELLQRVPELKGIRFDHGDPLLKATLNSVGSALDSSLENFVDVSAREQIFESRLDSGGVGMDAKREEFRHVIHWPAGEVAAGSPRRLNELRIAATEHKIAQAGGAGFVVTSRFMNLLEFLLPENQRLSRFRAVGRIGAAGAESVVLAYAYIPGSPLDSGLTLRAGAPQEPLQGLVWVDAKAGWLLKVLVEPLRDLSGAGLDTLRTEVVTAPVRFASVDEPLLLPVQVTTHVRRPGADAYTAHRLTEYRLYGVNPAGGPDAANQNTGVFIAPPPGAGAYEFLAQGVMLLLEKKDAAAVAPLRDALRLDASLASARVQLGMALDAAGDSAGAESELREAGKQLGGVSSVHSALGVVLFRRGSVADAVAEFREAVRAAPKDPAGHANLAQALEKQGDLKGALEELRTVVQLDPRDAGARHRLDALARNPAAGSQQAETAPAIRVDVRQVVVPVLVRDSDGHQASGLKLADFRVLEDGVEQTITAFQVETSGQAELETPPAPGKPAAQPAAPAEAALPKIRHTYLICIDAMHAAFGNLHYAREALQKFFASQRAGDSQYAVIALGRSMNVLRNLTQDPAQALASLDDKNFTKMALSSQLSSWENDIRRFSDEMNEIRTEVDSPDPHVHEMGVARMKDLPSEAQMLASVDRSYTVTLLRQLKDLVAQMTKAREHRTLLLLSDGFQMSAGREAWLLMVAYFPELSKYALSANERLSDEFDAIVKVAARSGIVIDTIDARGLYTPSFYDASRGGVSISAAPRVQSAMSQLQSEAGDSLVEFAAATGGTAYRNSNDILAGIQQAVADGRDYYTLAYVSTNPVMDGKFRTITVEVKAKKLKVKAKRGYWATEN